MANVNQLFNRLLDELATNQSSALKDLLDCLHSLLDVLPIAATLRPIQQYKLLQGLLFAQSELQFFKRLLKESEQKQALARYCLKNCELGGEIRRFLDGDPPALLRYFFESGSTIAHCIGMFAESLFDAQQKRIEGSQEKPSPPPSLDSTVVTNNLTGVMALAGLVREIEPVQGRLSLKYFGFFPFAENDANSDWETEGKRFNSLAEDIESCEAVFATCSNFSFLAGPIVGGRDNCLTKRAMYSGAERWEEGVARHFYLMFTFEKTVPLVNTYGKELGFESPQPTCGCVFAAPSRSIGEAINKWRWSHDEDDPVCSEDFDGTWHDELRELATNGRRASHNSIRIPVEKFEEATLARRVRIPHKLRTSWIEWMQHSIGLNILISLPRSTANAAFKSICEEAERANQVLAKADCGIEYEVSNQSSAVSDLVVHIVTKR